MPFRFFRAIFRLTTALLILLHTLVAVGLTTSYGLPHRGVLAFSVPVDRINEWHILIMDVRTRQTLKVSQYGWRVGVTLEWSPNGQYLVYATYSPRSDVFVVDVYNRQVYNLTDDWAEDRYPSWSPDGQHIVFYSNRDQLLTSRFEVYVTRVTGSETQRITFTEAAYPVWSPDGTQLVYSSRVEGNLYSLSMTCTDVCAQSRLTSTRYDDRNPVWSPDSQQIAFITFLKAPGSTSDQIFVIDRDGSDLRLLADGWRFQGVPSWSPDGRSIAFVGKAKSEHYDALYVADAAGNAPPRKLAENTYYVYNERWPMWSPDSRYLAYSQRGSGGLYIVEATTGYTEKLSTIAATYPVWQPQP